MTVGAVIVAAGMSSRMGEFKPLLPLGSIPAARRIVLTLQQAGVQRIVMVTGYKAELLEKELAHSGVVFLRNERYAETEMFDSAKLGFAYLRGKCERILFTPVDIPLFTADTVRILLETSAPLVTPRCGQKLGHPIVFSASLTDALLSDSGEGGLRAAWKRCGVYPTAAAVRDKGVLFDMDTPADYAALLTYHNSRLARAEVSVTLSREVPFFDEKTALLLSLVEETGSVRAACTRMQISYSFGWGLIHALESQMALSLLERRQGGARGARSVLTESGKQFLMRYEAYVCAVRARAGELFEEYFGDLL